MKRIAASAIWVWLRATASSPDKCVSTKGFDYMENFSDIKISRRSLLKMGAASATAVAVPAVSTAQDSRHRRNAPAPAAQPPVTSKLSFTVNGELQHLELDTRTTLLDALREHLPPHRHQEGLRSRPVRRLHGDRRRPAHQLVPDARGDARGRRASPPSRGWARPTTCTRCRPPSSSMTATSAATARRGRSARPSAVLDEIKAGIPSHVSADLNAPAAS